MDVDGFADPYLASLYDIECPWHVSDDHYLGLVMSAQSVLDVGCGTGIVLDAAVRRGHTGRLVGLDPAAGMLDVARRRQGVEWVLGTLSRRPRWTGEFDLVTMTGHAFQELRADDDVRDFFAGVRQVLRPGGRLAFETRNPQARAWDGWHGNEFDIVDPDGRTVHLHYEVETVDGDDPASDSGADVTVTFTESHTGEHLPEPLVARSRLRFMPAGRLDELLGDEGFVIDERYGDWDRRPFAASSAEIITIASVV